MVCLATDESQPQEHTIAAWRACHSDRAMVPAAGITLGIFRQSGGTAAGIGSPRRQLQPVDELSRTLVVWPFGAVRRRRLRCRTHAADLRC